MTLRLASFVVGLLVASQTLTGCLHFGSFDDPDSPSTVAPSTDARPTFRFTASRGCPRSGFDACTTDRPLMVGVRERITVSLPNGAQGFAPALTTDDASVVRLLPLDSRGGDGPGYVGTAEVFAGDHAGTATLTLTWGGGGEARVVVRVVDAAGMDLVEDEGTSRYDRSRDHITLRVGERISMNGYPVDLEGTRLLANDGVVWSVPSAQHVGLSWTYMSGAEVADDHVYFEGRAPGTEVVTVRAGVVERTLVVDVQ